MPTYTCTTLAGRLDEQHRLKMVDCLTTMHAEETGAPRSLVQVLFYEVGETAHFIGGHKAPAGQVWIRADIRGGRTEEVKRRMLERMCRELCAITGSPAHQVWIYICDIPSHNILEYGQVMCPPGQEEKWFAGFPPQVRDRVLALG